MKKNITIKNAAVILFALMLSCANQVAPGGGPEDKAPPEVDRSLPEHGQLRVDPRSSVTILFSEWINIASAQRAVSVYPALPGGVSVKAAKNRITVIPQNPLSANTTYQVVVGTALQDLRGNSIREPIVIAFSTGDEIDSGRVSGVVIPYEKRLSGQIRISLFHEGDDWDDSKYFSLPEYAAFCDSVGAFNFSFLREGRYRAVAFVDEYRTGRMRSGDECYTPVEQTITVTKDEQTVFFYPSNSDTSTARADTTDNKNAAAPDTTTPELKTYLPARLSSLRPELRLVWTKPARLNVSTLTAVDTAGTDSVVFFRANTPGYSDTTFIAPARSLLPGNVYTLTIRPQTVRDERGNVAVGKAKKIPINTDAAADQNDKGEDTDENVTADSATTSDTADTTAAIAVDSMEIRTIEIIIRTVAADSICYRLEGGAECLADTPDERRKWVYNPIGWQERFITRDRSGTFVFDTIPASKGTIMWFSDADNDNRVTPGRLFPWRAPERFFFIRDTIEAKARWEIEGLKVDGCPGESRRLK